MFLFALASVLVNQHVHIYIGYKHYYIVKQNKTCFRFNTAVVPQRQSRHVDFNSLRLFHNRIQCKKKLSYYCTNDTFPHFGSLYLYMYIYICK